MQRRPPCSIGRPRATHDNRVVDGLATPMKGAVRDHRTSPPEVHLTIIEAVGPSRMSTFMLFDLTLRVLTSVTWWWPGPPDHEPPADSAASSAAARRATQVAPLGRETMGGAHATV